MAPKRRKGSLNGNEEGKNPKPIGMGPLKLKNFHPQIRVTIPGMVVLNSKPGGGKSHMTRFIMREYRRVFSHGLAFSRTGFRPGNLDYIPNFKGTEEDKKKYENFKHPVYDEEVLRAFLNLQRDYAEDERPFGFVIFDDDTSDPGMWKTSAMIDLATMYRQFNILVIINTQYVNLIPPVIRECATQTAIFKTDSDRAIQACYDSYGQDFNRREEFQHYLFNATKDAVLGQKEHKFIWKDKDIDAPWVVLKAPEHIPEFRIVYGQKKATKKRKRTTKGHTPNKSAKHGIGENIHQHLSDIKKMHKGDPHEDTVQLPYDPDLYNEMLQGT